MIKIDIVLSKLPEHLHNDLLEVINTYQEAYQYLEDNCKNYESYKDLNRDMYNTFRRMFPLNSSLIQRMFGHFISNTANGRKIRKNTILYCSKTISFPKKRNELSIWTLNGKQYVKVAEKKKRIICQATTFKKGVLEYLNTPNIFLLSLWLEQPAEVVYIPPKED